MGDFSLGDIGKVAFAPVTGGASLLPGVHSLRDNPVSNFILGAPPAQQPGVGGPAKHPENLVRDPSTGAYFDPTTGTSYTDAYGTQPIQNPNVAQQVAANYQRSTQFLSQLPGLDAQRQQVFGGEQQLGQHLNDVIAGRAPSAAGIQLHEGLQDIANQQQSQAASVGGAASPLAQLAAMRNTGSASIAMNNAASLARVKERQDAENALQNLLGTQGQQTEQALGRTTQAGFNFGNLAESGQEAQQNLNRKADEQASEQGMKVGGGAINFLSGLI